MLNHVSGASGPAGLPSPALPHGYDRVAQHFLRRGLQRRQLAMCASLMSLQASRNPRLPGRRRAHVHGRLHHTRNMGATKWGAPAGV